MAPAQRQEFDAVVAGATGQLAHGLQSLNARRRELVWNQWMMSDVATSELVANLQHRLAAPQAPRVIAIGRPAWLHCDAHALVALLEHLVRGLARHLDCRSFDLAATAGDGRVYLDLIWPGQPVAESVVQRWLRSPLAELFGVEHALDVVDCHNGTVWSQRHGRAGYAMLRLPVPALSTSAMAGWQLALCTPIVTAGGIYGSWAAAGSSPGG